MTISLFPTTRDKIECLGATIRKQSLAERQAYLRSDASDEARDALLLLLEAAGAALKVTDPAVAQLLPPGVPDALRRLGEHVAKQSDMIRRMI